MPSVRSPDSTVRRIATSLLTLGSFGPERVAPGVWRLHGNPGRLNVFLLEDEGGELTLFDSGGRILLPLIEKGVGALGRLRRVVLSHAHTDHRGTAGELEVPVFCHPAEVVDVQGSGGLRYWGEGLPRLPLGPRLLHRWVLQPVYDGGAVPVAGTVVEGELVSGFRVVHLPGHAPGLIALVREADGLGLTSDAFYTVDAWWRDCRPYVPGDAWSWDVGQARASLRRLAELDLAVAWPGHGRPLQGDVASALAAAAISSAGHG